jgi:glycosyltransferase involved in cell wall biosynthesis
LKNIYPISTIEHEVILVEDRSKNNAWYIINSAHENSAVKAVSLSRHFGQHFAMTAGLEHADNEWVVVIDRINLKKFQYPEKGSVPFSFNPVQH